jgi:flagellar biosynthesis protein FlhG
MPNRARTTNSLVKGGASQLATDSAAAGKGKIIAITSGKGGVGKSNIAVNLAIALSRFGHRVLVVDSDFGLANLDMLLGLTPRYNLSHVIAGKKQLQEVVIAGPSGIKILPANSNGRIDPALTPEKRVELIETLRSSPELADTVFIDTGGGITDNIVEFLLLADEIIIVTTPEPTSIMDSYGVIRVLAQEKENSLVRLLVNMAEDEADAQHAFATMKMVARQFFNVTIEELGWINLDYAVPHAVRRQQPFSLLFPSSQASRAINRVAMRMANYDVDFVTDRGPAALLRRVISFFK